MQVYSSDLLCCAVEEQSLVLSLMDLLLSNDTYLITLRINNATSYGNYTAALDIYPYAANFSFTASTSTYWPVPSLETVRTLSNTLTQ